MVYGSRENRTKTEVETLLPKWGGSFVFEYDEDALDVTFLFFVEDPDQSGVSELFGQIVVPLTDPTHPVPENSPLIAEVLPIVAADASDLSRLSNRTTSSADASDINSRIPTWPIVPAALRAPRGIGGAATNEDHGGEDDDSWRVGQAAIAVTLL